jgi:hypothetical protein
VRKKAGEVRSRRDFFAGALRYAALGLMAAGGLALFVKKQKFAGKGQCINNRICTDCKILENCSLPQAASARQILTGVDNGKK